MIFKKKPKLDELLSELENKVFNVLKFSWEPRDVENINIMPNSPLSIEFIGGHGREIQARIVSVDSGAMNSAK